MRKRKIFIAVAVLWGLSLFGLDRHWHGLALGITASLLALSLLGPPKDIWDGLAHVAPPFLFVLSASLVFVYFPNFGFLFKSVLIFVFAVAFYAILLSQNIFRVAADRGARFPLFRAAQTASFLLALFGAFLFLAILYKSSLPLVFQVLLGLVGTGGLAFSHLWFSYQDSQPIPVRALLSGALLIGLGVGELGLASAFLPIKSFFRALALATGFYIGLGFYKQVLEHSFNRKFLIEHLVVAVSVALILLIL